MFEFVIADFKWGSSALSTPGGVVNWSIATSNPAGRNNFDQFFTDPTFIGLIRDAFQEWENVANIDFEQVTDGAATQIVLGLDGIDGVGNTLADASTSGSGLPGETRFSATFSEIRFDTAEPWNASKTDPGQFFATAVHEIGHAIGLNHTGNPATLMYEFTGEVATVAAGDIAGAQAIYGTARTITTGPTAGNDTINLTAGDDVINGLAGLDTAVFTVARAAVQTSKTGDVVTATGQGTDVLTSIERLQFTDGVLAFDTAGEAGQAYRLYQAALDRTPDTGGLGFWIRQLDSDQNNLITMSRSFIASQEFQTTYGTPDTVTNDAFINLVYNNVLDRNADAAGNAFWNDRMANGASREQVLAEFSESAENQQKVAPAIDDGIWYV